jgi:hypothetical protein
MDETDFSEMLVTSTKMHGFTSQRTLIYIVKTQISMAGHYFVSEEKNML